MNFLSQIILMIFIFEVYSRHSVNCYGNNTDNTPISDEGHYLKKLRQELLITRNYDPYSRPVKNHTTQTKIDMHITINEFVELDTIKSRLITDAWFHIGWMDENLQWDPNNFGQLKQIHFGFHEIWKPDIVLINTADQDNMMGLFANTELIVDHTGQVAWITMSLLRSKCPIWANDWPFNNRPIYCRLTFCSLIYQVSELNITTPADEFFIEGPWYTNPKLTFINLTSDRYERHFESYGTYAFESITVQLKRKDSSFPTIVRIPTLVAVLLTLCIFITPITWPVRVHIALFTMFIQLLLILYIGNQLGPDAAIGLARSIANLRSDLMLTAVALILTIAFRRLLSKAHRLPQIPYVLSTILSGIVGRFLCFAVDETDLEDDRKKPTVSRMPIQSIIDTERGQPHPVAFEPNNSKSADAESRKEWMIMIVFLDRVVSIGYAFMMLPRLI